MDHFTYKHHILHAEDVAIPAIAEAVGTPFYCYSAATLTRHYRVFTEQFDERDTLTCFAVKANSNLAILALLGKLGSGADVVSEGEIRRARAAGIPAERIVFSGVAKQRSEMAYALQEGIYQFNVESGPELEMLSTVAASLGKTAAIAIRVNPDVDARTHAKISTGKKENKFGVDLHTARELYRKATTLPGIRVQGVSVHIGSQLLDLTPFREAFTRLTQFVAQLQANGITLSTIDVGGGFGIPYERRVAETAPRMEDYAAIIKETLQALPDHRLIFEPGRMIAGNAGILVTKVIYVKQGGERRFVIVDAAMNDLLRPSLYDAYHEVVPVDDRLPAGNSADLVGPVCETGDTLAAQQPLPECGPDDLLALRSCGAYGAVMSGTYNSRLLIPEILVSGDQFAVIRSRPTYADLLGLDRVPDWV